MSFTLGWKYVGEKEEFLVGWTGWVFYRHGWTDGEGYVDEKTKGWWVLFFFLVFSSSFFHLFMIVAAKGVCSPEGTNDMWLSTSSHGQFDGSPSFISNNIKASSELKNFFIHWAIIIPYWYGVVMKPFAVDFFCVAFKIVVHRRDQQVWGERYQRYRDFVFWTNNPLITFHISLWYFVSIRIQCHISFIDATNKPYVAMLNNTRGYQMIYDFTPHPMDNLMAVQVLSPIIQKQAVSWRKKCLLDNYSVLMVS